MAVNTIAGQGWPDLSTPADPLAVWRHEHARARMYPEIFALTLASLDNARLSEYLAQLVWLLETVSFSLPDDELVAGARDLQRRCHKEASRRGVALVPFAGHLAGLH